MVANPIELAVALGLPAAAWALVGLSRLDGPPAAWAALAVLLVLTLGGRNLSEVARLWLPLMPPLLVAAGPGLARLGAGRDPRGDGPLGVQTLILQATIQVVYPT